MRKILKNGIIDVLALLTINLSLYVNLLRNSVLILIIINLNSDVRFLLTKGDTIGGLSV